MSELLESPGLPPAITIPLRFKNVDQVYKTFMPFLSNGGLFIPTKSSFEIGDEVNMVVKLPNNEEKHTLKCAVVWINPEDSIGDKKQGIGVEFPTSNNNALRHRIEGLLGERLTSDDATYTM